MKIDVDSPQIAQVKRYAFIILGMHRSGTSALTRILSLAGCSLPENLIGSTDGNQKGHWESATINEINNAILNSAGSSWQDWGAFSEDWYESPLAGEMTARVSSTISSEFGQSRLCVIKDPRISKIVPIWFEALQAVGIEPLPVLMFRHPDEVASSLFARNQINKEIGQLIWLRYTLDAEHATRGRPRSLVGYDKLLSDWKSCVSLISSTFDLKFPMPAAKMAPKVAGFLSPELRHHDVRDTYTSANSSLLPWTERAWDIFARWLSEGESSADHQTLDSLRQSLDESQHMFERLTAIAQTEHRNRIRSKELEDSLRQAETALKNVEAQEADRTQQMQRAEQTLLSVEHELKNTQVERDALFDKLEAAQAIEAELHRSLEASRIELANQVQSADQARLVLEADLDEARSALQALSFSLAEQATKQGVIDARTSKRTLDANFAKGIADDLDQQRLARPLEEGHEKLACPSTDVDRPGRNFTEELSSLESENRALKAKVAKLLGRVDDAEASSRRMAKLATQRDERISKLDQETKALRREAAKTVQIQDTLSLELMKALFSSVRYPYLHAHRLKNLVNMVKRLRLVDSAWYLERYPDVSASKLSAEEHFIRFGAREGRLPNSRFRVRS